MEEHNPYFPVPFKLRGLPEELRDVVRPAIRDSLAAQEAYFAIEGHWEDGGERTPATLLTYAFLRFVEACEIMVDDQVDEAKRALQLIEEAREKGAADTPELREFEAMCRDVWSEVQQRKDALYDLASFPPEEVHPEDVSMVAYELMDRGEYDRAVPFFRRAIDVRPRTAWHYRGNIASALVQAGRIDEARDVYHRIVANRAEIGDMWLVGSAYAGLIETGPDGDMEEQFDAAVAWAETTDGVFPRTHPVQERLLERAAELGSKRIALHVADVIEQRRAVPRELQQRIEDLRRRFRQG